MNNSDKIWWLMIKQEQKGPFSMDDIVRFLQSEKIGLNDFTRKNSSKNWLRIGDLTDLASKDFTQSKSISGEIYKGRSLTQKAKAQESKRPLRHEVQASAWVTDDEQVAFGEVINLNKSGMLLKVKTLFKAGKTLKLNIHPPADRGHFTPFCLKGVAQWVKKQGLEGAYVGIQFKAENYQSVSSIRVLMESGSSFTHGRGSF